MEKKKDSKRISRELYDPNNPDLNPKKKEKYYFEQSNQWIVEKLVDKRFNEQLQIVEYQVKWLGFSYTKNTWEPISHLQQWMIDKYENRIERGRKYRENKKAKKSAKTASETNQSEQTSAKRSSKLIEMIPESPQINDASALIEKQIQESRNQEDINNEESLDDLLFKNMKENTEKAFPDAPKKTEVIEILSDSDSELSYKSPNQSPVNKKMPFFDIQNRPSTSSKSKTVEFVGIQNNKITIKLKTESSDKKNGRNLKKLVKGQQFLKDKYQKLLTELNEFDQKVTRRHSKLSNASTSKKENQQSVSKERNKSFSPEYLRESQVKSRLRLKAGEGKLQADAARDSKENIEDPSRFLSPKEQSSSKKRRRLRKNSQVIKRSLIEFKPKREKKVQRLVEEDSEDESSF